MKNKVIYRLLVLTVVALLALVALTGCDEMDNENHNTDEGRTGTSGASLIMTITPSRVPSNSNSTMNVHCRLVDLEDLSPIPNVRIRLAIQGFLSYIEYLDPYYVSFGDDTLLTDVVTNSAGEASVLLYVGNLPRAIPELPFTLDGQATLEYRYSNVLTLWATETFYIYNPHWDGSKLPDKVPPTAVISFFPSTGIIPGTTITFMGANSYDGDPEDPLYGPKYDEIVQYSWNFADGNSASGKTVNHTYIGVGTYNVGLFVVDDEGMTGQATASVSVVGNTPVPTN